MIALLIDLALHNRLTFIHFKYNDLLKCQEFKERYMPISVMGNIANRELYLSFYL